MDFGEVVTTSSRAFWSDYEDWEASRTPSDIITLECIGCPKLNAKALESLDTFIVIEGTKLGKFFLETLLHGSDPVCRVVGRSSWLYVLEDKSIGVFLSEERDLMTFGPTTELLVPYIRAAKRVLTLNVEPSVSYKVAIEDRADDNNLACFVRGINTKGSILTVKDLKEPNLITGIAAGVASWCKFSEIPWSSFVAYLNEPEMNALTTAPILRLLRDLGIPCAETYRLKQTIESNLYT